ncbi:MAG TPA: hypothetical protein VKM72_06530 [Thermoanaerobaculia bacterium]|nr:hypothetical protein [Thermoanaerobaculia bacterium]
MGRASRRKRDRRSGLLPQAPAAPQPFARELPATPEHHREQNKISAALLDLVEPYLDSPADPELDQIKSIVAMAALAWNLSLLTKSEQAQQMRQMLQDPELLEPESFVEILRDLIGRKLELFPHDSRRVLAWEVRETKQSFHVMALCTT